MAICNYKQNDPTWAAYPYAGETMGPAGCGPTACADLLGISPVTAASWLTSHGYASNGSGTFHSGITALLRAYGNTASQITGSSYAGIRSANVFEIFKDHIKKGGTGIILFGGVATGCRTDYWSRYGHYCAVVGYRESDGAFLVHDPAWDARDGWHSWDNDIAGNIKHLFTCSVKWSGASSTSSSTASKDSIKVDGLWGNATTKKAQKVFRTVQDGIVSNQNKDMRLHLQNCQPSSWEFVSASKLNTGSNLVKAIQRKVGATIDGFFGMETLIAFQKWLGVTADGFCGDKTVRAFQTWLNKQ